jgi:O-antigen/teichoic acid export membrane protein
MIKKIITTFFTRFFIALSNLVIAIILSNYTGAAGRGEQSLIITLITFIIIITSIIGSSSISYLLPRHSFISLIIPSYLWVLLILASIFLILPYLNLVPASYVADITILSLLLGVQNINTAVLISRERINAANMVGFIQSLVIIIILLVYFVLLNERTIEAYIVALYGGYGVGLFLSFILIRAEFRATEKVHFIDFKTSLKRLVTLGFYNQVAVFTQLMSFRLSYYILNGYFGKEEVGIYSNAVSIAESIWLIGRSIATVQLSRIVNTKNENVSLQLTSRMNRLNLAVSAFCLLILSFIPSSWYIWIFGAEFAGINQIIWALAPGILFFGVALVLGYYFSGTGRHYVNAIASTAGLIVTVILGFIIIPVYQRYGAGITASISYGVTALIVVFYYRHQKNLHSEKKSDRV